MVGDRVPRESAIKGRCGATAFEHERTVQPLPRIGQWKDDLDRLLASNEAKTARERRQVQGSLRQFPRTRHTTSC